MNFDVLTVGLELVGVPTPFVVLAALKTRHTGGLHHGTGPRGDSGSLEVLVQHMPLVELPERVEPARRLAWVPHPILGCVPLHVVVEHPVHLLVATLVGRGVGQDDVATGSTPRGVLTEVQRRERSQPQPAQVGTDALCAHIDVVDGSVTQVLSHRLCVRVLARHLALLQHQEHGRNPTGGVVVHQLFEVAELSNEPPRQRSPRRRRLRRCRSGCRRRRVVLGAQEELRQGEISVKLTPTPHTSIVSFPTQLFAPQGTPHGRPLCARGRGAPW